MNFRRPNWLIMASEASHKAWLLNMCVGYTRINDGFHISSAVRHVDNIMGHGGRHFLVNGLFELV